MSNEKQKIKLDKSTIIILVVLGVVVLSFIGIKLFQSIDFERDSTSNTEIESSSDIEPDLSITEQSTEPSTESTVQSTTAKTKEAKVGEIENIKTDCYSIYDEYTGFSGVIISFSPAANADGYRLEYIFDDEYGNEKSGFQDIEKNQVQLYFSGQDLPAMIKATPFNDKEGMLFGTTVILYNGYYSHFDTDLTPEEWNNLTKGFTEIRPFDYYEY